MREKRTIQCSVFEQYAEYEDGCTWLGYNSPQTIVDDLDLHDVDDVTCMMTNALDALTEYAVKE